MTRLRDISETVAAKRTVRTMAVMLYAPASRRRFLDFTFKQGNDLVTPRPEHRFKGLKHGDKWCLCALRWKEALAAGVAPPVILESTHQKALEYVTLDQLRSLD